MVESAGEGADAGLVGKRVAVAGVHGAWAESFVAPAAEIVPLPDAIPDELGAQLIRHAVQRDYAAGVSCGRKG